MADRLRTLVLLAAGAALALLSPTLAPAQTGSPRPDTSVYEVKRIRVVGNRLLSDSEIKRSIRTEQTRCKSVLVTPFCMVLNSNLIETSRYLDRVELARDMYRIRVEYALRGYREATVDTTVLRKSNRTAEVVFRIQEGKPVLITGLAVTRPVELLSDRRVRQLVPVETGDAFDLIRLDTAIVNLRTALWNLGYSDAIVNLDTTRSGDGMQVEIEVNPRWVSRVNFIQIKGNSKIGQRTIRNTIYLKVGDIYKLSEAQRSQRALYESGLFKRATVESGTLEDSLKILVVDVAEAPLREARIGMGVSTVEFFQLEGFFQNLNWMGGAKRASLNASVGNLLAPQLNGRAIFRNALEGIAESRTYLDPTWRASADLRIPALYSPSNEASFSAFAQRRSLPGIFVDRSFGANAVFTRELGDRFPLSVSYQFEVTRVAAGDLYFCVNFGLCDPPTISALRSAQRMSPLSVSTTIERANHPIDATRGYNFNASIEHASSFTLSDYRYNRATAEASAYFPLLDKYTFAVHARAGWVDALGSTSNAIGVDAEGRTILHPRKRFYAGGARSVRGFGEGQLGPRILTIPRSVLTEAGCTVEVSQASCSEATLNDVTLLPDSVFTARPLGGNLLAEASVEVRFPILKALQGAVFVDAGLLGESGLSDLKQSTIAVSPGFGIRYKSAAGPIRVDLGYNPFITEALPVVTEVDDDGRNRITELQIVRSADNQLAPARRLFTPQRGALGFLSQFTLHLSIGQAF